MENKYIRMVKIFNFCFLFMVLKMKAAILKKLRHPLEIEDIDEPEIEEPDDIIIKIMRTGICYRDLLTVDGFFPKVKLPIILGHEIAGIVEDIGGGVTIVKKGDKVVSLTYVPCGKCEYCKSSKTNLCNNRLWFGELLDGSYAEYIKTKERSIVKVPKGVGWNEAAISACVTGMLINALKEKARLKSGDKVLITGAGGGVGIHAIQVAKAYGAEVIAATSSEEKIKYIKEVKPDEIILFKQGISKQVKERYGGVDIVIEAVGEPTFYESLKSLKWGGKIVVIGNVNVKPVNLQLGLIILRENYIMGNISSNREHVVEALNFSSKGLVKAIGEIYPLDKVNKAHKMIKERKSIGRVFLTP